MARYTGPKCKLARREGTDLFLKSARRSLDSKCKLRHHRPVSTGRSPDTRLSGLRRAAAREAEAAPHLRRARAPVPPLHSSRPPRRKGVDRREPAADARSRGSTTSSTAWASARRAPKRASSCSHNGDHGQRQASSTSRRVSASPGDVVSESREARRTQLRIEDALQLAEKVGFPEWVEVDAKKMKGTFKARPDRSEFAPGHQRKPRRRAVLEVTGIAAAAVTPATAACFGPFARSQLARYIMQSNAFLKPRIIDVRADHRRSTPRS